VLKSLTFAASAGPGIVIYVTRLSRLATTWSAL